MQVQAVHLVVGQHVHLLLQVFQAIEVAAAVEHQSAPPVTWIVGDGECGELFAILGTELGEGFPGILQACRTLCHNADALARKRQPVFVGMRHGGIDAHAFGSGKWQTDGASLHLHLHGIGDDVDVSGPQGKGDEGKKEEGEGVFHGI